NARLWRLYFLGLCTWIIAFVFALNFGIPADSPRDLISQLRFPRALLASAVGIGLSVAGAVLQALFSNPLCEPYTLGISSGAALGAVLAAALGINFIFFGITGSAFVGALLFGVILYFISRHRDTNNLGLLMAGVMLGFLGSSLVALWMALADPNGIQSALFWLLGDLSRARPRGAFFSLFAVLSLTLAAWGSWRKLDGLLMGEQDALTLGIPVPRVRTKMLILVSLLIAVCVSAAGMIGFIGLVIPHFARRAVGSLHQKLIPLCAIWGAAFLTFSDALSRSLFRPYELPVGVLTALLGAPLFLLVMFKRQGVK
ncbi:MAG: hypothetical protein A2070_01360, partial [Bdellovibrionales bacterium GWC1_52_8]